MHEKYKEYVQQQHAPEELVQSTIKQMQKMQAKPSYSMSHWGKIAVMAACFCGFVILGIYTFTGTKVTYYNIDGMQMEDNFGNATTAKKTITVEQYDDMLGTNLNKIKDSSNWKVTTEEAFISYKDGLTWGSDETEVINDGCSITLEREKANIKIQVSKNNVVASSALLSQKANHILENDIYLGYDKEKNCYYAAFTKGVCSYCIQGENITEKGMTKILKELLKVI